jgi:hypothetical protein
MNHSIMNPSDLTGLLRGATAAGKTLVMPPSFLEEIARGP